MKDTRLWQIFTHFSLKDLRELAKCVRSPYFNQREYVVILFDYLRENKDSLPQKEVAFDLMFPNKSFDDHLMRNAMSLLMQLIEKYLSIRDFMEDESTVKLKLSRAYRRMNLEKHYLQTIKRVEESQQKSDFKNADFYQNEYQLEAERYQWLSNQKRMAELNLQEISDNLDLSYITQKLRQTCFSLSHQAVYPKDYDFGLLEKMLELLETEKHLDKPAVAVYYYCYRSLTQSDEESFFRKFKSLLLANAHLFPVREKRDLYLLATNYCIKKMNAGERQYAREGLDIYKDALQKEVLFVNGSLSRFTFFNIITKGLVCEEFDWIEEFINTHQHSLEGKHRAASASYSMARLEYHRGDHAAALQLLQKADYEDLLQNLQAKAIMAKIFFESEEVEVLLSHLDAMEQFIRRRKVIGYHQELFRNFILLLKRRIEIPDFEKEKLRLLKKEIEDVKAVAERRWLLKQV